MRVREEVIGAVTVLSPVGDLDLAEMPALEGRVAALLEGGVRLLLWDLAQVGMLPSTAAGLLLQSARRVQAAGGRMALAAAGPRVLATLRTMGVLEVFRVYPDRDEGLRRLSQA